MMNGENGGNMMAGTLQAVQVKGCKKVVWRVFAPLVSFAVWSPHGLSSNLY